MEWQKAQLLLVPMWVLQLWGLLWGQLWLVLHLALQLWGWLWVQLL